MPMLCLQNILIRKKGIEQSSKSIARRAGSWLLGPSQKLGMVKHTPHGPSRKYTLLIKKIATLKPLILLNNKFKRRFLSKSVYDSRKNKKQLFHLK